MKGNQREESKGGNEAFEPHPESLRQTQYLNKMTLSICVFQSIFTKVSLQILSVRDASSACIGIE